MTSKSLFFNLMIEDLKRRIWSIALSCLTFFFIMTMFAFLIISNNTYILEGDYEGAFSREYYNMVVERNILELIGLNAFPLCAFIVILAVVVALSGFAYLHSKKKVDFYHSLPVKREFLFAAKAINGILIVWIPYIIFGIITAAILMFNTSSYTGFVVLVKTAIIHLPFFIAIYMTAITAVLLTSNIVVGMLGVGILYFIGPIIVFVLAEFARISYEYYLRVEKIFEAQLAYSSPVTLYISYATGTAQQHGIIAAAILIAALLTVLNIYLYKLRASEATHKAMSFNKSKSIIKIVIVIAFTWVSMLAFMSLDLNYSIAWTIFGFVIGAVLSHAIIEVIYNFDIRKAFANPAHLLIAVVIAGGIYSIYAFDITGYDKYFPSEQEFDGAGIADDYLETDVIRNSIDIEAVEEGIPYNTDGEKLDYIVEGFGKYDIYFDNRLENMRYMDYSNLKELVAAANSNYRGAKYNYDRIISIDIYYHLKNGSFKARHYDLPLSLVQQYLFKIYESEEYKSATYEILEQKDDFINSIMINKNDHTETIYKNLDDTDFKSRLLNAYRSELKALTGEEKSVSSAVATISFNYFNAENAENVYGWRYYNEYPIFPSFKQTIDILAEIGIIIDTDPRPEGVKSINISNLNFNYNYSAYDDFYSSIDMSPAYTDVIDSSTLEKEFSFSMTIEDEAKIKEILDVLYYDMSNYQNTTVSTEDDLSVELYGENGEFIATGYSFISGKVPRFIVDELSVHEELNK